MATHEALKERMAKELLEKAWKKLGSQDKIKTKDKQQIYEIRHAKMKRDLWNTLGPEWRTIHDLMSDLSKRVGTSKNRFTSYLAYWKKLGLVEQRRNSHLYEWRKNPSYLNQDIAELLS